MHRDHPDGLSSQEAAERLARYGPNTIPEERPHPIADFLRKFWAPVPWMLEAALALELAMGKHSQAVIIGFLLVFNAVLSSLQERRAQGALALLRQRLSIQARVMRDGHWSLMAAEVLVPGDLIHLRMGDLVPADARLVDGALLLDQSALTGESAPVQATTGASAYSGSTVKRGEATGEVTATGQRTYFGKTAELVRIARTAGHLESVILSVVKYLIALDGLLVVGIIAYGLQAHLPFGDLLPFALILLVASVPVALPTTFTLATALGSHELAERGVLVTRLSAIEEAAAMDVLCSDKTGTITENRLALAGLVPFAPHTEDELLRLAALASDESTQDPIDLAVLSAANQRRLLEGAPARLEVTPFDPATKRSEAVLAGEGGIRLRAIKGAPKQIAELTAHETDPTPEVERLAVQGYRVLAVGAGTEGAPLELVGLIGLQDPPRSDSRALVQRLEDLGVRVLMVTGDGPATARAVAAQVDVRGRVCSPEELRAMDDAGLLECGVFAGVFPEDKFRLVEMLQRAGHVAGMTGDGVNDAPALKQAEVGIAVASATDVARAAASIVLTTPGLTNVLAGVESGRRIYQRMLTYTLNKVVKTFQVALFLAIGLLATGLYVTTPRLILLLIFANDFVTMSLATDRVSFSRRPDRWDIRALSASALVLALLWLAFAFGIFFLGKLVLHLDLPRLQTLSFLMLVFTGQATVYLVRERHHFWHSRPSRWLALSSVFDVVAVSLLAIWGILMAPIEPRLVGGLFGLVLVSMFLVDLAKVSVFRAFGLRA